MATQVEALDENDFFDFDAFPELGNVGHDLGRDLDSASFLPQLGSLDIECDSLECSTTVSQAGEADPCFSFSGLPIPSVAPDPLASPFSQYLSGSGLLSCSSTGGNSQPALSQSWQPGSSQGRRKKSQTKRDEDWEPVKDRIIQLHIVQDLPVREVMGIVLDETGFHATEIQYKRKLKDWNIGKNVPKKAMKAIVRKQQARKILEPDKKPLVFRLRDEVVPAAKVDRWMDRNRLSSDELYSPPSGAGTPEDLASWTAPPSPERPAQDGRLFSTSSVTLPQAQQSGTSGSPLPSQQESASDTDDIPRAWEIAASYLNPSSPATVNHSSPVDHAHDPQERTRSLAKQGLRYFRQSMYKLAEQVVRRMASGAGSSRTEADEIDAARSLVMLASVLASHGDTSAALTLAKQGHKALQQTLGHAHVDTLYSELELAILHLAKGELKEADAILGPLLAVCRREFGHSSELTLNVWSETANLRYQQGRFDEARDRERQVWSIRRTVQGESHPCTIAALGRLVQSLLATGAPDAAETERLARRLVVLSSRAEGTEHPSTLGHRSTLAAVWAAAGAATDPARVRAAAEVLAEVRGKQARVFGAAHPRTLATANELAKVLLLQGRCREAGALAARVLRGRRAALGPEHPATLQTQGLLLELLMAQGRLDEAEGAAEELFAARLIVLGGEHPATVRTLDNLHRIREALSRGTEGDDDGDGGGDKMVT